MENCWEENDMVMITDTTLRDAHQSLLATRMRIEDILPIAKKIDEVGYHSVEMWGGATFDSCMRFLKEDPWERIRLLKKEFKKTPLQMLLRGQNIVGYKHYPDDVLEAFVKRAAKNGIDVFRIFDALNDLRNLEMAIEFVLEEKKHAQGALCYTVSPVHTTKTYLQQAKELEKMGCNSLCIKDMAGLLDPKTAFVLIKKLKKTVEIPINLHTHCTSGMAIATYLKAIEAGVDIVDTACSSLSLGTSQPPVETIVAILNKTKHSPNFDLELLSEISEYFEEVRKKYRDYETKVLIDVDVLKYQVPGGMLSNLEAQLKQQNALDRIKEVLEEVSKVRKELGYPPLVTPSSQIVGTQATLNVILGKRYKVIPKEVKAYVKGLYGKPPAKIKKNIRKKIIGDEKPIDKRPADFLKPQIEKLKKDLKTDDMEKILSYALFPDVSKKFYEERVEDEVIVAIAAALFKKPKTGRREEKGLKPWAVASRLEGVGL